MYERAINNVQCKSLPVLEERLVQTKPAAFHAQLTSTDYHLCVSCREGFPCLSVGPPGTWSHAAHVTELGLVLLSSRKQHGTRTSL